MNSVINRIRSRQAGHPSGLLGRIIGRAMVASTAPANDRAIELLDLTGPTTILEVGFGQGRTTDVLARQGHTIRGVEVSATMLRQATAKNRAACEEGRVELMLGDGISIPFDDNSVDAAFTAHTIYFMSDPALTLADVARVLRPGGRFVLACRVGDDPMPEWMDPAVYDIPSTEDVLKLLTAAGFTNVTHHSDDSPGQFTHWFEAS